LASRSIYVSLGYTWDPSDVFDQALISSKAFLASDHATLVSGFQSPLRKKLDELATGRNREGVD